MLLHASPKFHRHYRPKIERTERCVQPFPQTWNVDILPYGRSQIIAIASEEYSLFSFLIPLSRSTDYQLFLEAFRGRLISWMENIRLWEQPDTSEFILSQRNNRRIIGTQNDFLFVTKRLLLEFQKPVSADELEEIEREINSMPMSYLDMNSPDRAIWEQRRRLIYRGGR